MDFLEKFKKLITNSKKESEENIDYLSDLFKNIENIQKQGKTVSFKIIDVKQNGFSIKVAGLFGYVSFAHMPWEYNHLYKWRLISKFLINKKYYCKIHSIKNKSIVVDAKYHKIEPAILANEIEYKGIVLKKLKFGLLVDIGYDFNWEHGAIIGLIYTKKSEKLSFVKNIELGDIITTCFDGYRESNKIVLKNKEIEKERIEKEELFYKFQQNTEDYRKRILVKEINGKKLFFFDEKPVQILKKNTHYKHLYNKQIVSKIIDNLNNDDFIECNIVSVKENYKITATLNVKKVDSAQLKQTKEENQLIKLIGTEQEILVRRNNTLNKPKFYLNKFDKRAIKLPILKSIYNREERVDLRNILKKLEDKDIILCEIIGVYENGVPYAKLLFEY